MHLLYRYADNGLYAVKGTLQMPFHFVKKYKFIYYKYAAKARQTNGLQFEHILTSKKWNGCRCLDIPDSQKKQGGWFILTRGLGDTVEPV